MTNLLALMRREWVQYRVSWLLLALVPLALALLLLGWGSIELDAEMGAMAPPDLALVLSALTVVISVGVMFLLFGVTSLFVAIGAPRRDHGDRSVEFWLSLPSGHAESLAAPMLVHLLLVPAAAVLAGLLAALPVSLVVVWRVTGAGAWWSLPWAELAGGVAAFAARLLAGLPLALAWLLPLLLAAMLANAFFRRWGLPLLVVAVALLSVGMDRIFGQPWLVQAIALVSNHAATSLIGASAAGGVTVDGAAQAREALLQLPGWAARDFGVALGELLQPAFAGALLVSAAFFAILVGWRQRLSVPE
jgi:ABC-2 type transport system permease protein